MGKGALVILTFLFVMGVVSALPIYVSPLDDGRLQPDSSFNYTFNFTSSVNCSGILLSNVSEIVTNAYGAGFIDLDISGLSSRPSYLCEYRDGSLRKVHNFSDMVLGSVWAEEFVGDGVGISNLNGSDGAFDGWDKNASDDMTYTNGTSISLVGNVFSLIGSFFSGSWNDLTDVPSGFGDGVDNDTTYSHLSNFSDDLVHTIDTNCSVSGSCGLLTYDSELSYYSDSDIGGSESAFDGWDKNSSDDMTYTNGTSISLVGNVFSLIGSFFSGSWNDLTNVPSGFSDGTDNDSQLSESQVDAFASNNGYLTSYSETDPYWTGNKSSYSTTSVSNTLYAPINYGSNWNKTYADTLYAGIEWDYNQTAPAIAYADATFLTSYTETDPYWTGNKSSYSTTAEIVALGYYNESDVDGVVVSANSSMKSYVDARDVVFNDSVVAWADAKFVDLSGGGSLTGQYDFDGDWQNGGVSIVDGKIYAQSGWFYNISSLEINNLEINGSVTPDLDDQFDLGSVSAEWRDLYLSGEVVSNGTGDSWFLGDVGIGTGAPDRKFHVYEATNDKVAHFESGDDNANIIIEDNDTTMYLVAKDSALSLGATATLDSGNLNILSSGNVGIGTTAPGAKLEVKQDSAEYGIFVDQNANYPALYVDSESTSYGAVYSVGKYPGYFLQDISGGQGLYVQRNIAEAGSEPLVEILDDHTSGTQTALYVKQDGSGIGIEVDGAGTGYSAIFNNGNVGIGTGAPGTKLHVNGTGDSAGGLRISNSNENVGFFFTDDAADSVFKISYSGSGTNDIQIQDDGDIVLAEETGNVGIGTAGPLYPLDVRAATSLVNIQSTTGTNRALAAFTNTGGTVYVGEESSAGGGLLTGASAYAAVFAHGGNYPMQLGTNNVVRMTILGGGNVGIGTAAPDATLEVEKVGDTATMHIDGGNHAYLQVDRGATSREAALNFQTAGTTLISTGIKAGDTDLYRIGGTGFGATWMAINTTSGNVGIGTGSPSSLLSIYRNDAAVTQQALIEQDGTGDASLGFRETSGQDWSIGLDNSDGNSFKIKPNTDLNSGTGLKMTTGGDASFGATLTVGQTLTISGSGDSSFVGNVGIGTAAPQSLTHLHSTGTSGIYQRFTNADTGATSGDGTVIGIGSDEDAVIYNYEGTDIYLTTTGSGDVIIDNGNVGIGTAAPTRNLQVQSSGATNVAIRAGDTTSTAQLLFGDSGADNQGYISYRNDGDDLRIGTNGGDRLTILDSGNVGIGTTGPGAKLHIKEPIAETHLEMKMESGEGNKLFRVSDIGSGDNRERGYLELYDTDVATVQISSNSVLDTYFNAGNVGIGTTAPAETLDVRGNIGALAIDGARDNDWVGEFKNQEATAGRSFGVAIQAGSSSSDKSLLVQNYNGTASHLTILGDGNVGIGTTAPGEGLLVLSKTGSDPQLTIKNSATASGSETGLYFKVDTGTTDTNRKGGIVFIDDGTNGIGDMRFLLDSVADGGNVGSSTDTKMIITHEGNVGIGTTAPGNYDGEANKLVVGDSAGNEGVTIVSGTDSRGHILFADGTTSNEKYRGAVTYDHSTGMGWGTADSMGFRTAGTVQMVINNIGNVGIGTTAPTTMLQVASTGNDLNAQVNVKNTGTGAGAGARFTANSNAASYSLMSLGSGYTTSNQYKADGTLWESASTASGGLGISQTGNLPIGFWTDSNERMTILGTGNVGIGTTAPAGKLDVKVTATSGTIDNVNDYGANRINIEGLGAGSTESAITYNAYTAGYPATAGGAAIGFGREASSWDTYMAFYTNNLASVTGNMQENMRINSDGNVGIGTTSPSTSLSVIAPAWDGVNGNVNIGTANSDAVALYLHNKLSSPNAASRRWGFVANSAANGLLEIRVSADSTHQPTATKLAIDSSGKVLIAGTTAYNMGGESPNLQVNALGPLNLGLAAWRSADTHGAMLAFSRSRSASVGTYTIVQDNDIIGDIRFGAADGANANTMVGRIIVEVDDAAPASNSIGGAMAFHTAAGVSADDNAERMRIDKDGNVGIGTTDPTSNLHISSSASSKPTLMIENTAADSTGPQIYMRNNKGSASAAGDDLGAIWGGGSEGVEKMILFEADDTWATADRPTRLVFLTTPDSSATETERMRIDMAGNVGIGTTAPGAKLEVWGGEASATTGSFRVGDGSIIMGAANSDANMVLEIKNRLDTTVTKFDSNGNSYINGYGAGNVGIGTVAPDTLFHVEGSGPYLTLENTATEDSDTGRESQIRFQGRQSGGEVSILAKIQGSHDSTGDDEKGDLIFYTNDGNDGAATTERMRIDSSGNVGIGTTAPTSTFDVKGTKGIYDSNGTTTAQPLYQEIAFSKAISGTSAVDVAAITLPDNYAQGFVEFVISGENPSGNAGRVFAKRFYELNAGTPSFTTIGTDYTYAQTVTFADYTGNAFKIQVTNNADVTRAMSIYIKVYGGGSDNSIASNGVVSIAAL